MGDKIGSKGTGLWSVQEALEIGVPCPSLAEALLARQMSMHRAERIANSKAIPLIDEATAPYTEEMLEDLYWLASISIIASYAQMFQCLRELDKVYEFGLNLPETIATFRAGCILQGYLLKPMTKAFEEDPNLSSLLVAFAKEIKENFARAKGLLGKLLGGTTVAVPVMCSSLTYLQTMVTK